MLGFLGYGGRSPHVTDACPTTTRKERSRRSAVTRLTGTTDPDGRDLSHTAAGGSWLLAHERVLHEVHAGQSPESALCFGGPFRSGERGICVALSGCETRLFRAAAGDPSVPFSLWRWAFRSTGRAVDPGGRRFKSDRWL